MAPRGQTFDPGTGGDGVQTDAEVRTAEAALRTSQESLDSARQRYDYAAQALDSYVNQIRSGQGDVDPLILDTLRGDFEQAARAVQTAETERSQTHARLSAAYGSAAGRTETPAQRAEREAQAAYHQAQAQLAKASATALAAKTPTEIATAQAELAQANANILKIGAEIGQLIPAQAANLFASAAEAGARSQEAVARATQLIPAQTALTQAQTGQVQAETGATQATTGLTQAQTGLVGAQTGTAQAQTGLVGAQTGLAQAQTGLTGAQTAQIGAEIGTKLPAEVRNTLAQAGYTEAQIRALEQQMAQPRQLTQGLENPQLAFQGPPGAGGEPGPVYGVRNPAYTPAGLQAIQNEYDTIDTIKGMMEKGQMSPGEADQYMNAIREQTAAAMRGTTPFQEAQQRQRYAAEAGGIGRDLLMNRVAQGTSLSSSLAQGLLSAAPQLTRPFNFQGFDPLAMAREQVTALGGGQDVYDTAARLIQGLAAGGAGAGSQPAFVSARNVPTPRPGLPAATSVAATPAPAPMGRQWNTPAETSDEARARAIALAQIMGIQL